MKSNTVTKNCLFCQSYRHEEVGDSDYGAIYASIPSCGKYLDIDVETEEDMPNFDRNIERECCDLDFWAVVEVDQELQDKLIEESNSTSKMDETYKMFLTKYNNID
jgi:hypothetical protein